jgi:hypothetical protein
MNKISMWISVSCVAAMSVACGLDVEDLSVEERAEIDGVMDVHVDAPESLPEAGPSNKLTCGGILGTQCPGGMQCIDFPGDGCNPNAGGADCLGMCVGNPNACTGTQPGKTYYGNSLEECSMIKFFCPVGEEYFADECGCGCQATVGGSPCGDSVCGQGLECCNASCGICVEPGGFCTQKACL